MNDYKKLIGDIGDLLIAHPSENVSKMYLRKAVDAIEQLVTDRNAACNELCSYCGQHKEAYIGACDECKWRASE